MTKHKLRKALHFINWSLYDSDNGLNDFILNHHGKRTNFKVSKSEHLEIIQTSILFGNANCGSVHFPLKDFKLEVDRENQAVNLFIPNTDVFISFYNFDDLTPIYSENKKKDNLSFYEVISTDLLPHSVLKRFSIQTGYIVRYKLRIAEGYKYIMRSDGTKGTPEESIKVWDSYKGALTYCILEERKLFKEN